MMHSAKLFCIIVLICSLGVRSDWILTQECNSENKTQDVGVYLSGDCQQGFGLSTYGKCNAGKTWDVYTCQNQPNCNDIRSCDKTNELPMNECINGMYTSCTATKDVDLTHLGWPAAAIGLYGKNCEGDAISVYVAKQNECFNTSQGTGSFSVTCSNDGGEAKLALYTQTNCGDLTQTIVVGTNNCTTVTQFLDSIPVIVQCSN
jgi:hypothetical protein